MNLEKWKKIKKEINMADKICRDIDIDGLMKKIDYISSNPTLLDSSGKLNHDIVIMINRYGEQISLACEHYLKSMIIPRMHYSNVTNESEDELNKIFADKGKDNIKSYSHYFDKLLTSDNTALKESPGLQEAILINLSKRLKIKEYGEYISNLINSWISDDYTDTDVSKKRLLDAIKKQVDVNASAYPESRYSVFTNYQADLDFLIKLCLTLREMISRTINQCIYVESIHKHIFPDNRSHITIRDKKGNEFEYINDMNRLYVIRYNEYILNKGEFRDMFPQLDEIPKEIEELTYIEDGEEYIISYDDVLNMFIANKKENLTK